MGFRHDVSYAALARSQRLGVPAPVLCASVRSERNPHDTVVHLIGPDADGTCSDSRSASSGSWPTLTLAEELSRPEAPWSLRVCGDCQRRRARRVSRQLDRTIEAGRILDDAEAACVRLRDCLANGSLYAEPGEHQFRSSWQVFYRALRLLHPSYRDVWKAAEMYDDAATLTRQDRDLGLWLSQQLEARTAEVTSAAEQVRAHRQPAAVTDGWLVAVCSEAGPEPLLSRVFIGDEPVAHLPGPRHYPVLVVPKAALAVRGSGRTWVSLGSADGWTPETLTAAFLSAAQVRESVATGSPLDSWEGALNAVRLIGVA